MLLPLVALAALASPGPGPARPACDSAALHTPVETIVDTLRLTARGGEGLPRPPHPWLDLVLDEIATRVQVPRPLVMPVYDPEGMPGTAEGGRARPTMRNEVRVRFRADGRVDEVAIVTRSLADEADLALVQAIRDADSARALLALPEGTPSRATLFVSLTLGALPAPLRAIFDQTLRDVAALRLPVFGDVRPVAPVPGSRGPRYPVDERRAHREGDVRMEFVVDERGEPMPATFRLTAFTSPAFARAVLEHLRTARYDPATIGGCPVKVLVQQPFQFRLSTAPFPP